MSVITTRYIVSGAGKVYDLSVSNESTSDISVVETVSTGQTDKQINVAVDVTALKCIWINSDQNVTLETNDGTSPDETINLVANKPYVWTDDSYFTNLLATDITAIFITNASGATATISILGVQDATP